jgi:hypothetical protein
MLIKTVERQGSPPYLACSSFLKAGDPSSADLIPAMLSIVFEKCQELGWIDGYPIADDGLRPEIPSPVDTNLNSDTEESVTHGELTDHSTTDDDSSYRPESGSSPFSSPEPKRKRSTRQPHPTYGDPKKSRRGAKQVRLNPYLTAH